MGYRRRWKPSVTQKREYAQKMREAEEQYTFIKSEYPIREGCFVKWVDKSTNDIMQGTVTKSTYRSDNQHSFTVDSKVVMGRNIYDRLLVHTPGIIAKDKDHPLNNRL